MRRTTSNLTRVAAATALAAIAASPAFAQELKIGLSAEPSAMDPHFHNLTPNNMLTRQIFDTLAVQDENQQLTPGLAESWKPLDATTWEFKLRKDVKFSNGDPFTANDVIYSYCRAPRVEGSPSSFAVGVRAVQAMTAPDPYTLIIKTATTYPLIPLEASTIAILNAKLIGAGQVEYDRQDCKNAGTYPKTEDFNNGKFAIGTGPYKLAQYTKGDRIVFERNDTYWGPKQPWAKVTLRPITSAGPRVAALLAGDVDFIENVPIQDLARVEANKDYKVVRQLSNRIIYLHFNYLADSPPGVTDTGNGPKNPWRNAKVREAIAKAIDRDAIVARIMGGVAVPAGEALPTQMFGANKDMTPTKADPAAAKKLLAEAGYPNGFSIVIGTPNDRYINDAQIAQAIAQMLNRIGIKTSLEAMTASQFFTKRNKAEFGIWLAGWGADTGEMSNPLKALLATPNKDKGFGTTNPGGYSNPKVDAMLEEALATVDDTKRAALLAAASKLAMADYGFIPLHFEGTTWGMKKTLEYKARVDQYTMPSGIAPVK